MYFFRDKFGETLPANWLNLAEQSPQIETEKVSGLIMLLPAEDKVLF